jgi:hypothetical protein
LSLVEHLQHDDRVMQVAGFETKPRLARDLGCVWREQRGKGGRR